MKKLKLELNLVLPEIDHGDACVQFLTERLQAQKGVDYVHIDRTNGHAALCIHYDPNLLPLAQIERLAQTAGAEVTSQYRHEQIPMLPLTDRELSDSQLGTRHRAALGVSEQSDALVVVVSEETGRISVARNGRIVRIDARRLRTVLSDFYSTL